VLAVPLQPRVAHRGADEHSSKAEGYHGGNYGDDEDPYQASEAPFGEDLQVEEEKLDLDEAEESEVDEFADPEVLGGCEHTGC